MPELSWRQRAITLAALSTISAAAVTSFSGTTSARIKPSQTAEHNHSRINPSKVTVQAPAMMIMAAPLTCPTGQEVAHRGGQDLCQPSPKPYVPKHRRVIPSAPPAQVEPVEATPVATVAPAPAPTPTPTPTATAVAEATTQPAEPSGSPQQYAESLVGAAQFACLLPLWNRESGWSATAENPSGAYGIPQSLPGSKMAAAGADWASDPYTQIRWGVEDYIAPTYGDACAAWAHEQAYGWY